MSEEEAIKAAAAPRHKSLEALGSSGGEVNGAGREQRRPARVGGIFRGKGGDRVSSGCARYVDTAKQGYTWAHGPTRCFRLKQGELQF
jgi:hypothetical protein